MRLLFTSLGAHGHTLPLLPLTTAARATGHEVEFATGPALHPTLREAGVEPLTAGTSIREGMISTAHGLFGTAPGEPGFPREQNCPASSRRPSAGPCRTVFSPT
ncbi:hypothetical protein [Actinopolyspora mortivallis]|uniref:hypothetical protein n=1 Tax=Actinopolyspora mortivallis TaxID=33906 RepID=UPI0003AABC69|nr:hypothetical protein [Actinopolyspora mortivallis]